MFIDYVITFFAIATLDIVYTYYLRCVQKNQAMPASLWAVACYVLGSIAIINYTENHWLMLPAMAGAFFGTYVGMILKRNDK